MNCLLPEFTVNGQYPDVKFMVNEIAEVGYFDYSLYFIHHNGKQREKELNFDVVL